MKNILILVLILIPFVTFAQSDVPDKYWINDNQFENKINAKSAFVMMTQNLLL